MNWISTQNIIIEKLIFIIKEPQNVENTYVEIIHHVDVKNVETVDVEY